MAESMITVQRNSSSLGDVLGDALGYVNGTEQRHVNGHNGRKGENTSNEPVRPVAGVTQESVSKPIAFNVPPLVGQELVYINQAIQNTRISGDGPFTKRCHQLLEESLGVPKVLLTTSCTHALEMAALLLNIQPGDEVIVPSFTFVSTVNAFVLRGARPIFADIRPDTLNMDETQLAALITPRTRAIVPVHYAGVACEMDTICAIAAAHQIAVVEDNAHGLFGKYKGRYL